MLHTKFKTPEHSCSEEEDFEFFMYFYGLKLGLSGAGPSWTKGPSSEQTW